MMLLASLEGNKMERRDISVDKGLKLNLHMTFGRRPGRLLNVLCALNLCPVSTGIFIRRSVFYLLEKHMHSCLG